MVSKTGNSVIVEAPGGAQYSRNTAHVKRFMGDDPVSSPGTPSASHDEVVIHTAVPSKVLSELTSAAPATPQSEPPIGSTLSAQTSAEDENEAVAARGNIAIDRATVLSAPATLRLPQRPQRQRRPPERYKHYVLQ